MKLIKKLIYTVLLTITIVSIYTVQVKATTVTVTADTLNLREKASTSSDIVATLSNGVKCDLLGEENDWYQVKYKTYTGYVSKEYVKKNEDDEQDKDVVKDDTTTQPDTNTTVTEEKEDTSTGNESGLATGKISSKVDIKIVPLIYSSKIGELAKDKEVMILSELNGWSYIQTDMITGWIRSNYITDKKNTSVDNGEDVIDTKPQDNTTNNQASSDNKDTTSSQNSKDDEKEVTEKIMYVNESSVNVRKEANTSSKIMMVLALNTKLTVIGESGDWYKVKTSEGNGYVSKPLLSDKQITSSRGGSLTSHASTTSQSSSNVDGSNESVNSNITKTEQEVVKYAKQFLGVPYIYGGASKSGFDCSGFTMYVYRKFGVSMRHGAQAQAKIGTTINANKKSASSLKSNLRPGDLVFFLDYETMDEIGHCGIYIGDGDFIHASSGSGYCVKINSLLPGEYYNTRYCGARRVI